MDAQNPVPELWPQNSTDLNRVDSRIWGMMQVKCIRSQYETWPTWSTLGMACRKALSLFAIDEWYKGLQAYVDEKSSCLSTVNLNLKC